MSIRIYGATSGYIELDSPPVGNSASVTLPTTNGVLATESFANNAINTLGALVYITSQTFSGASSVSVNNCFTNTYDNYKILIIGTCNQASWQNARIRSRSNGSDLSTGVYYDRRSILTGTTFSGDGNNAATSGLVGYWSNNVNYGFLDLNLFRFGNQMVVNGSYSAYSGSSHGIGQSGVITSGGNVFDGFTLYSEVGTISGNLRVYGYRNS